MEQTLQTPPKTSIILAENTKSDQNTPPPPNQANNQKSQSPISISGKTGTPDRLKLPKALKYPERYTSPTDQMMSPVTRGILARSRKGSKLLPPSLNQPKIQALQLQELGSTPK
ncbi:hypothetical protein BUALT_Bualt04G0136200 [Buddleja alternifolia]|uniref:Uncharacterized protein n=1 Tax=Buddleja alternifolia TaxID=168488 RepID=A0AAV6XNQ6_9LAMI|nr:hypothetical protein BUALT_Bualt04G0136200 [Buddleja alternifolia]